MRVPKVEQKGGSNDEGLSEAEYIKIKETYAREAFKRGAMNFEDYNYKVYNPYILVQEPKAEDRKKALLAEKRAKEQGFCAEEEGSKLT